MAQQSWRPVKYDDPFGLPDHVVDEIIEGERYISPLLRPRQTPVSTVFGLKLHTFFGRGGDPGGWCVLVKPRLYLGDDVAVPDLAAWRNERRPPNVENDDAVVTVTPDWVCDVPSRSTTTIDRGRRLAVYARERVPHVWFLDPTRCALEVRRLDGDSYRVVLYAEADAAVRAEPFDAIELALAQLWRR